MIIELKNRLSKRFLHLQKWAKRQKITCFRVYFKDLTDYPFILDFIEGDYVLWLLDRTSDDTPLKAQQYADSVISTVCETFSLDKTQLFVKSRQKQQGLQTQYHKLSSLKKIKVISEFQLKFELNLSDYLDIGLFLDHRFSRKLIYEKALNKDCLNLFSYTGSFSCYMALGGANSTLSVDLNSNYCEWAQRNLNLNGFDSPSHQVLCEDCLAFLSKKAHGRRFDLIVCDPPTFSNSKKMKQGSFSVDRDYVFLIQQCVDLLRPSGVLLFSCNSKKFRLDTSLFDDSVASIQEITHKTVPEDFKNQFSHRCFLISKV